ncbi:PAN/Apple domain-containing protein [Hirschfeldia incana]|nr:PAN/Apple domain-containing protein [Hirschfeldia incana]
MSFRHILFLSFFLLKYGYSGDILRRGDRWVTTVKGGTLVSSRGTFEAGFFRFPGKESWFIGIWYKNLGERTYVWVGNRKEPLHSSNGTLEIDDDDQLVIRDRYSNAAVVVSTTRSERRESNSSSTTAVAQLLENGNLVLKDPNNDNPEDFFWESFSEPTDTILPEMKLQWNSNYEYLTSWRAVDDPQPGNYDFRFESLEFPVLAIWHNKAYLTLYRSGPWNGNKFIGATPLFRLERKHRRVSYLSITSSGNRSYTRVQLDYEGLLREYTWNQRSKKWDQQWNSSLEQCDLYHLCPRNAYCRVFSSSFVCECIPGFAYSTGLNVTTRECVRKKNGTCNGDHFSLVRKMNLPQSYDAKSNPSITKPEQCGKVCLGDCTCTAYSISISLETGNQSCITWSGDLVDLRSYSNEGLDLYVRTTGKKKSKTGLIVEIMMPGERENAIEDPLSAPMDFAMILKATDNFSQEIGHGGFGYVYKGVLASGEEIAVKKLSKISEQGLDEFRTEGVAQGLAYIEEGGYDLILHRDLKPDNILLDRDMTPKISDFGLARMCARTEKEVFTQHTAGTKGYISPESLLDGIFSSASDVYSFGVIVLEIVNGKRNRSFSSSIGYLLGYAWNKYNEGNWSEIIDEKIRQECVESWQVLRCIEVGLLCSQYFARDRPKISLVVAQLQQEKIVIQMPKRPGCYPIDEGKSGIPSSSNLKGESSTSTSCTVNRYTLSEIDAR